MFVTVNDEYKDEERKLQHVLTFTITPSTFDCN